MAVAVDEAWFLATFPDASAGRVVSFGKGIGGSAFLFTRDESFPTPPTLESLGERIALIVLTFTSGIDTSPTSIGSVGMSSLWVDRAHAGLDAITADAYQTVINGWYASVAGIDTSPTFTGGLPMGEPMFAFISQMVNGYLTFAPLRVAAPVARYMDTLDAASMPMAPVSPVPDGAGIGSAALLP
jgi:hypothetical protein